MEEIKDDLKEETLIISLNESVSFNSMKKVINHKIAKVIPNVTAEINQSQTLICYNELVEESDKENLKTLLQSI